MPADGGEIPVAPEHLGKLADCSVTAELTLEPAVRQSPAVGAGPGSGGLGYGKGLEQISDPEVLSNWRMRC